MRAAFLRTLVEAAESRPNLWLLSGDLGFSVLEPFIERFPDRYINVGVAEQNMAGIAAGLGLSGRTVVLYSIGNFPTLRCFEQLRNDVCYHGADVKVVAVGAGLAYGAQGYIHHTIEDLAVMAALPGMEVFSPADPVEAVCVTRHLVGSGRPGYMRLSKAGEPALHTDPPDFAPGRALPLSVGRDATLIGTGAVVELCCRAAGLLAGRGISAGVTSMPSIVPFDGGHLRAEAARVGVMCTVEEHIAHGGLAAAAAWALLGLRHDCTILPFTLSPERLKVGGAGERASLLARSGLTAEAIADAVERARRQPSLRDTVV